MNGLAIVGCTITGTGMGFVLGAWYGELTETGDLPMGVLLGIPGALVGGLLGCIIGVMAFT